MFKFKLKNECTKVCTLIKISVAKWLKNVVNFRKWIWPRWALKIRKGEVKNPEPEVPGLLGPSNLSGND
jgi:hypothetical protein